LFLYSAGDSLRYHEGYLLAANLGLSRKTVTEGGSATAFGYTMPGAKVTLHINGELLTTTADASGYYQFLLKSLKAGTYSLYATANYQQKDSLSPTKKAAAGSAFKQKEVSSSGEYFNQLVGSIIEILKKLALESALAYHTNLILIIILLGSCGEGNSPIL